MFNIVKLLKENMLLFGIVFIVLHCVIGYMLNELNKKINGKSTPMAFIPLVNLYLLGRLAFNKFYGFMLSFVFIFTVCATYDYGNSEVRKSILPNIVGEVLVIIQYVIILLALVFSVIKLFKKEEKQDTESEERAFNKNILDSVPTKEEKEMFNDDIFSNPELLTSETNPGEVNNSNKINSYQDNEIDYSNVTVPKDILEEKPEKVGNIVKVIKNQNTFIDVFDELANDKKEIKNDFNINKEVIAPEIEETSFEEKVEMLEIDSGINLENEHESFNSEISNPINQGYEDMAIVNKYEEEKHLNITAEEPVIVSETSYANITKAEDNSLEENLENDPNIFVPEFGSIIDEVLDVDQNEIQDFTEEEKTGFDLNTNESVVEESLETLDLEGNKTQEKNKDIEVASENIPVIELEELEELENFEKYS